MNIFKLYLFFIKNILVSELFTLNNYFYIKTIPSLNLTIKYKKSEQTNLGLSNFYPIKYTYL